MNTLVVLVVLLSISSIAFYFGRQKALVLVSGKVKNLHSLPFYYGMQTALWCGLPAIILYALWLVCEPYLITQMVVSHLPIELKNQAPERVGLLVNDVRNLVEGNIVAGEITPALQQSADYYRSLQFTANAALLVIVLVLSIFAGVYAYRKICVQQRARNAVETTVKWFLILSSTIAIFTTIGIVLSVLFESLRFFQKVPVLDFLFGMDWSPQMSIREDQVGSSGAFGAIPLFAGTFLITVIAMSVAVPIGLLSAIYLSEYAAATMRMIVKPLLEILAGVPTVVYGFFAALVIAPLIRNAGFSIGLDVSSESALAAGLVMGVMIIPFVSSLSDDVINAVPQTMRDASYGLGATQSETILKVIIPAALPGIVGGVLLAVSRAIGETMIVVMAAGLSANLTANPLEAVTTVTVQIVTLLVGDQEFDSPKTLAAFALGLVLFLVTLVLNVIALHVVRKYREEYE